MSGVFAPTQSAVGSSYRRFVRVTKLLGRFAKTLYLVEKLDDETGSGNFSATRRALGATNINNAVFSSADEHEVLLYFKTSAAHPRGWKRNANFNDFVVYFHAALLPQELRTMFSPAFDKHPLKFKEVLLTETAQMRSASLLVKKGCLRSMRFYPCDLAEKKKILEANVQTRAWHNVRAAEERLGLRDEQSLRHKHPNEVSRLLRQINTTCGESVRMLRLVGLLSCCLPKRYCTKTNALPSLLKSTHSPALF